MTHASSAAAACRSLLRTLMPNEDPSRPFLLFDDASGSGRARLFSSPLRIFRADGLEDVTPMLERVRAAGAEGMWCAGFLTYEAGHAFEPRLRAIARPDGDQPLAWFAAFGAPQDFDAEDMAHRLAPTRNMPLHVDPLIGREDYRAAVMRVLDRIRDGEIYQLNLTFQSLIKQHMTLGIYRRLRERQKAAFGAMVSTGEAAHFSFSPELFFSLCSGRLTTRPMKGTARRGASRAEDARAASDLAADAKNRAENLMIVDLMRNDLSRIAEAGSVAVPELFRIETYPTIHQMTSTVTAKLRATLDAISVLEALFPCGSITGAPKIRAMELIRGNETGPRGLYTGSIGWIAPDGDAQFNVAIRTLSTGCDGLRLGLGSGIVADSDADDEWHECLAKAGFLDTQGGISVSDRAGYKREYSL